MQIDASVINTVLLIVVLPVLGWLTKTLGRTNTALTELRTVLIGLEGQGGLSRRVEGIADRTHRLEQATTVLLSEHQMKLEDFKLTTERRGA